MGCVVLSKLFLICSTLRDWESTASQKLGFLVIQEPGARVFSGRPRWKQAVLPCRMWRHTSSWCGSFISVLILARHPEIGTKATAAGLYPTFLMNPLTSFWISSKRALLYGGSVESILLTPTMSCFTPKV